MTDAAQVVERVFREEYGRRFAEAAQAYRRALALAENVSERALLVRRLGEVEAAAEEADPA